METPFKAADWAIVAALFTALVCVAVHARSLTRTVSDFLAGNRCAGRYLLTMSGGIVSVGLVTTVANFEKFFHAGFAVSWWGAMLAPLGMLVALSGWVAYRYRQTRALTMAQFFEMRYSRRFRVFAGVLAWLSGILNYGIFPGVVARFIVNYTGLPQTVGVLGWEIPTIAPVMLCILGLALVLTLSGGMVTIMVTDFLQAQFINLVFITVVVFLLWQFTWGDITATLAAAPAGRSLLDPFDQANVADFNLWFYLIFAFKIFYNTLGWQGLQGYYAAARSPHEARMAGILGSWRNGVSFLVTLLLPICAYVYLNNRQFAEGAAQVRESLAAVADPTYRNQVTVPVTIAHLLPVGLTGLLCAAMIASAIGTDSTYLHSWGSIFIQDVVLPFRKKPFTPEQQIRLLRWSIFGVAAFGFLYSLWFPMRDYLLMYMLVTGAVYLAGSGAVIIGGLYWSRGTSAAAWAAMITGAVLAVGGGVARIVHPAYPLNGAWSAFVASLASIAVYITVSLLTCRRRHDMDALLHRNEPAPPSPTEATLPGWMQRLGISKEFTRGDRAIYLANIAWTMFWFVAFILGTLWAVFGNVPDGAWSAWWRFSVLTGVVAGAITVVWFLWGGSRDLRALVLALREERPEEKVGDDGRVNAPQPSLAPEAPRKEAAMAPTR